MKKKFIKQILPSVIGYCIGAIIAAVIIRFGFRASVHETVIIECLTASIMIVTSVAFFYLQAKK